MARFGTKTWTLGRRGFLNATALGLGALVTPGLDRFAAAAPRANAPARRLLVINLSGGIRASGTLYASTERKYNPWSIIDGAPLPYGSALLGTLPPSVLGPEWENLPAPDVRELFAKASIIGTWDEKRGDHSRAGVLESTGDEDPMSPGILTRAHAGLDAATKEGLPLQPFELNAATNMGAASGLLAAYAAVSMSGPADLPISEPLDPELLRAIGKDWARDEPMRNRLDQMASQPRAGYGRSVADGIAVKHRARQRSGVLLAQAAVNVAGTDPAVQAAALGTVRLPSGPVPLTNAMLNSFFTAAFATAPAGAQLGMTDANPANDAALVVRLLQLGAPAVGLSLMGYDVHSGEATEGPPLYAATGRLLGSLAALLGRMEDPTARGRSMLDTTLILTITDFGRDAGQASTGFNGGDGCDHGSDPSCYYVPSVIFGGGVRGAQIAGRVETSGPNAYRGDKASGVYKIADVFATALWSLGLDAQNDQWGFPNASIVRQLWA